MTNQEIISKAMEKIGAEKLKTPDDVNERFVGIEYYKYKDFVVFPSSNNNWYHIIFSHKFAKIFWGEEKYYHFDEGSLVLAIGNYEGDDIIKEFTLQDIKKEDEEHLIEDANHHKGNYHWYVPAWQYHLQQMVLEEEPLKYLEKFL